MGVSAHRVNAVDFEIQPSFNVELDDHVIHLLETEFDYYYSPAGYKLSITNLAFLIEKLQDDDPMVTASFKRDLLWAKMHNTNFVMYHIVGDTWESGQQ